MKKLEEYIQGFDSYKEKFEGWEASMQVFDRNHAYWELRKPGSGYAKVCLYRDGGTMFVYGDYGNLVFDSMTWIGTPWNLRYNNIGYQMEKLSRASKVEMEVFDDVLCKEEYLDWLKDILSDQGASDVFITKVLSYLGDSRYSYYTDDIYDSIDLDEEGFEDVEDYRDIIELSCEALGYMIDESEWIYFLRERDSKFSSVECDFFESRLWRVGKTVHQRYYVNMYALKVISQKISEDAYNELMKGFVTDG